MRTRTRTLTRAFVTLFTCAVLASCTEADDESTRAFDDPLAVSVTSSDDWLLVFEDPFDGDALDPTKWIARKGDLRHKGVLNSGASELGVVRDGSLVVTAIPSPDDETFPYKAGFVDTRGLFAQTYGKIEFRARCQFAPGLWYAVWGRPWVSEVPEIDIEFLGANINQTWFVNHWAVPPIPADERRSYVAVDGMDITEFHTYAVTWKPDLIEWQIDGHPYMRATGRGVPHEPMYWIINAWVGGWGGKPNPVTIFPAGIELDYFRVWRLREWATEPAIRIATPGLKSEVEELVIIELADFDPGARVEVWEGEQLLATAEKPPFRFTRKELAKAGNHSLQFVGIQGERRAAMTVDVVIVAP